MLYHGLYIDQNSETWEGWSRTILSDQLTDTIEMNIIREHEAFTVQKYVIFILYIYNKAKQSIAKQLKSFSKQAQLTLPL